MKFQMGSVGKYGLKYKEVTEVYLKRKCIGKSEYTNLTRGDNRVVRLSFFVTIMDGNPHRVGHYGGLNHMLNCISIEYSISI